MENLVVVLNRRQMEHQETVEREQVQLTIVGVGLSDPANQMEADQIMAVVAGIVEIVPAIIVSIDI